MELAIYRTVKRCCHQSSANQSPQTADSVLNNPLETVLPMSLVLGLAMQHSAPSWNRKERGRLVGVGGGRGGVRQMGSIHIARRCNKV